jgi:HEAT repeat protein
MSAEFDLDRAKLVMASPDEEERRRLIAEIPLGWTSGALGLLVDALGDTSWRVRKDAILRVARWPDPEGAVTRLIAALADDSNVGLRNAAVEALAAIGRPSVAPLLMALDAGGEFKKFLIEGLAAIGDRTSVPALVRALDDADENIRAAAAEALGQVGGHEADLALRHRLSQADLLGRLAVLEALNKLGAQLPLVELQPLVASPILRRPALEAVGHSGDLGGLPVLAAGLADRVRGAREASTLGMIAMHAAQPPDGRARLEEVIRALPPAAVQGLIASVSADAVNVRRAAVTLLGWGRFPDALARLTDALRDEDVHAAAVKALVAYGESARAPLVELAQGASSDLRAEVFGVLARLPGAGADPAIVALLGEALEDDDPLCAAAAAQALGEVGGKASLAPLFHALERRHDPEVPQAACQALARLGKQHPDEVRMLVTSRGLERGETAVLLCRVLAAVGKSEDRALLLKALKADDAPLRAAAADAVSALGAAPEAREALAFALTDEESAVRATAATALGVVGGEDSVTVLIGSTADEDEAVRAAAVRALGQLGYQQAAATLRQLARRGDPGVAVFALEALGRLRGPSDDPAADEELLGHALGRPDPELVKAAVRTLAARPGPIAALLGHALAHSRWDVRRLAAQALASRIADEPAALELLRQRVTGENDPLVREVIDDALKPRS